MDEKVFRRYTLKNNSHMSLLSGKVLLLFKSGDGQSADLGLPVCLSIELFAKNTPCRFGALPLYFFVCMRFLPLLFSFFFLFSQRIK